MKRKVLVVEDEPAVLKLEKNLLQRLGFDVLTAVDAEQGFRLATEARPDAIMLDVMLQDNDGFSLSRRLRSLRETAKIPIIFVTAKDEPEDMIEGFSAGGKVYLTKPFTEKSLETAIQALLLPENQDQKNR